MLNSQAFQFMHLHGDDRYPMTERGHHDPADEDPERGWVKGARIFRCSQCDEEIVVMSPGQDRPDREPA